MYETVIGVEVHFELATETKLFCSCKNSFGAPVNTCCCPVCSGLPGALPVLNRRAVEYAVMAGLALGCRINSPTSFDRKNYFYPDMPNEYQISQFYSPVCTDGELEFLLADEPKKVRIREIHLEDDAGKLIHTDGGTLIDFNRAGVPLIEVVTQPDMRSAEETVVFLETLRLVMSYLGVSDCKMQEGSMRVDVNLSVHKPSSPLGTRTEMKNLNSFRAVAHAIESESKRQISLIESGGRVEQETRRFDDIKGVSTLMRTKEESEDYRYVPEPNLPPLFLDAELSDGLKSRIPELAHHRRKRYVSEYGLSCADATVLTEDRFTADFFEQTALLCGSEREAANRIIGDILREQKESGVPLKKSAITPSKLAHIIKLCGSGVINRKSSRDVISAAYENDIDIDRYIEMNGLSVICDEKVISDAVSAVIMENEKAVSDWRSGKKQAFGNIVGQTMKRLGGRADPKTVNKIVTEMLK